MMKRLHWMERSGRSVGSNPYPSLHQLPSQAHSLIARKQGKEQYGRTYCALQICLLMVIGWLGFGGWGGFDAFGAWGDKGKHEGRDVGFADDEGGFGQLADED